MSISSDSADARHHATWTEPLTRRDEAELFAEDAGADPSPQEVMEYSRTMGDPLVPEEPR